MVEVPAGRIRGARRPLLRGGRQPEELLRQPRLWPGRSQPGDRAARRPGIRHGERASRLTALRRLVGDALTETRARPPSDWRTASLLFTQTLPLHWAAGRFRPGFPLVMTTRDF